MFHGTTNTQEVTFTQNDFFVLKVNRYFGLFGDLCFFSFFSMPVCRSLNWNASIQTEFAI